MSCGEMSCVDLVPALADVPDRALRPRICVERALRPRICVGRAVRAHL